MQRDDLLVPNRHAYERLESHLPAVSLRRHTPADTDTYSNTDSNSNAYTDSDTVHWQMWTNATASSYAASTPIAIQRSCT